MLEKYVLFTNLKWVTIGEVRTFTYALLLQDSEGLPRERNSMVRGFGTDPAWPTFDIFVKNIEYNVAPARAARLWLELQDGPNLELSLANFNLPLDIEKFEGDSEDETVLRVWAALQRKVPEYWQAPNMPLLQWRPPSAVLYAMKGR